MNRIALTHLRLLDGVTREAQDDVVLIIQGKRIAWIGPRDACSLHCSDRVYDLQGAYVLPGLWDMHSHLDFRLIPDSAGQPSLAESTLFAYRRALTCLDAGVTSLRVVGTQGGLDFALRDGINCGEYLGPRIFTAGPGLASTGGHGAIQGQGYDGPYEFRRAARDVVYQGADLVKVMVTGGIVGRHEAFDALQTMGDEVQAAVEVAHLWGRHVAGHIASAQAAVMCAELGMDTIEHGYALDRHALQVMKDHGVIYVPTLVVTDDPSYWSEVGLPDWAVTKVKQAAKSHRRAVETALEMGVPIALGSDLPTPFVNGTIGVVREMEALAKLGAAPRDLIVWATQTPALLFGLARDLGTLETGKLADLIAVPQDPYSAVRHLNDVRFVMKDGRVIRDILTNSAGSPLLAGYLEHERKERVEHGSRKDDSCL
ncbi:MAG: amidohydrolase family protein [Bacillota bacterium]|jgi:imidazolonepropionase-like amidohydrolase|nr:amidohydrolase family protein [Bacillota bacterium]HHT91772.1 amidohydrolase family protein [Bacillota bacterium]